MSASAYTQAYAAWRADPEAWWAAAAQGITWDPPLGPRLRSRHRALRPLVPRRPRSTPATTASTATSHPAAPTQPALIWDSAMTGRVETFTYRQLQPAPRSWPARSPRWASPRATAW